MEHVRHWFASLTSGEPTPLRRSSVAVTWMVRGEWSCEDEAVDG
jgi:hypothetical protein